MASFDEEFASIKAKYALPYDALSREQVTIIKSILGKKDSLGIMPTGSGKSACFYLPPLFLDEVCP